ncbi:hypothetical protein PM082_015063 [Marasmius tenuissimus]|nr:hypothetical protein PM082_015063 [Marasmius tenuissimus]
MLKKQEAQMGKGAADKYRLSRLLIQLFNLSGLRWDSESYLSLVRQSSTDPNAGLPCELHQWKLFEGPEEFSVWS